MADRNAPSISYGSNGTMTQTPVDQVEGGRLTDKAEHIGSPLVHANENIASGPGRMDSVARERVTNNALDEGVGAKGDMQESAYAPPLLNPEAGSTGTANRRLEGTHKKARDVAFEPVAVPPQLDQQDVTPVLTADDPDGGPERNTPDAVVGNAEYSAERWTVPMQQVKTGVPTGENGTDAISKGAPAASRHVISADAVPAGRASETSKSSSGRRVVSDRREVFVSQSVREEPGDQSNPETGVVTAALASSQRSGEVNASESLKRESAAAGIEAPRNEGRMHRRPQSVTEAGGDTSANVDFRTTVPQGQQGASPGGRASVMASKPAIRKASPSHEQTLERQETVPSTSKTPAIVAELLSTGQTNQSGRNYVPGNTRRDTARRHEGPKVQISQIDVIVEAPVPDSQERRSRAATSDDVSSRHYLRTL